MLKVLGFPHLVLSYVGDDDGLFEAAGGGGFVPDVVDDVRGVEVAVVGEIDDVADCGGAFAGVDLVEPGGGFGGGPIPGLRSETWGTRSGGRPD